MKLGSLEVKPGAALGPMAGFTDAPCRRLMAEHGAVYTVSEMVSARALTYGDRKTTQLMRWEGRPKGCLYGVQLFGAEPEVMGRAAALIAGEDFDFFDINMGCPAPKITGGGAGSRLLLDPALCGQMTKALVQNAGDRPVSVKIRAGWDAAHITAVEVARRCEDAGAALIQVHARTQEQQYAPGIDPEIIAQVKAAVHIPVVGNGDITTPAEALQMLAQTGCDGVMVARGALGNPWLFAEIAAALKGEPAPPRPTLYQKMAAMRRQIYEMCELEGEHTAMLQARGQTMHYMAGLRGAAELRRLCGQLQYFSDVDDLIAAVHRLQRA